MAICFCKHAYEIASFLTEKRLHVHCKEEAVKAVCVHKRCLERELYYTYRQAAICRQNAELLHVIADATCFYYWALWESGVMLREMKHSNSGFPTHPVPIRRNNKNNG